MHLAAMTASKRSVPTYPLQNPWVRRDHGMVQGGTAPGCGRHGLGGSPARCAVCAAWRPSARPVARRSDRPRRPSRCVGRTGGPTRGAGTRRPRRWAPRGRPPGSDPRPTRPAAPAPGVPPAAAPAVSVWPPGVQHAPGPPWVRRSAAGPPAPPPAAPGAPVAGPGARALPPSPRIPNRRVGRGAPPDPRRPPAGGPVGSGPIRVPGPPGAPPCAAPTRPRGVVQPGPRGGGPTTPPRPAPPHRQPILARPARAGLIHRRRGGAPPMAGLVLARAPGWDVGGGMPVTARQPGRRHGRRRRGAAAGGGGHPSRARAGRRRGPGPPPARAAAGAVDGEWRPPRGPAARPGGAGHPRQRTRRAAAR